jgi:putative endonuclease
MPKQNAAKSKPCHAERSEPTRGVASNQAARSHQAYEKSLLHVYILANFSGTIYTGVTNNLERRLYEHKNKLVEGFTSKYNLNKLVYYEVHHDIKQAILREKQIKGWSRAKRVALIEGANPNWEDLSLAWA